MQKRNSQAHRPAKAQPRERKSIGAEKRQCSAVSIIKLLSEQIKKIKTTREKNKKPPREKNRKHV
jgi:hypothetical protein